jgi:hypothetical protein
MDPMPSGNVVERGSGLPDPIEGMMGPAIEGS